MNTIKTILNDPALDEAISYLQSANTVALIPEVSRKYIEAAVAFAFLKGQSVVLDKRDTRYEEAVDEIARLNKFSMPAGFNLPASALRTEPLEQGVIGVRMACGDPANCDCDKDPIFTLNAEDVIPFTTMLLESLNTNVVEDAVDSLINTVETETV